MDGARCMAIFIFIQFYTLFAEIINRGIEMKPEEIKLFDDAHVIRI